MASKSAPQPAPPNGLGSAGKRLWIAVTDDLGADWEATEREMEILRLAAGQADDLVRLEDAIKKNGAMVTGSASQLVVNPAIGEARQARLAISRLIGTIALPDEDDEPRTEAGKRGQKAARARWNQKANVERRRHAKA